MKNYDTAKFVKDLECLDISLTDHQMEQFLIYYEMLIEWNQKMNLTTITEYEDVLKKHFIDSLSLVKAYDISKPVAVIDVGTGAGFPGLALKIAYPNLNITLLDSLNKRVNFLNAVIERLELKNIETVHGRAEDFAHDRSYREQFDLCVSRAVANLSTLCEYCLPFVKTGGKFISYKSESVSEELAAAKNAIEILKGKLEQSVNFLLPDSDISRNFVVIEKTGILSNKYPRKAGLPGKEPLT